MVLWEIGLKGQEEDLGRLFPCVIGGGHKSLSRGRKVCMWHIKERGRKYGSKLYFYLCNGKCLMGFHGYLLVFFYLKYEREIRGIVHIMTIYNFIVLIN